MEADIDVVKGDGGGETGPGCSGYSSMVHSKKVIKHALRQQAKRRRKNTTIAAGNSRTLPRIVVKPLPPPPPNDPPSPVNNLPHIHSVVEEPAATMREVLASLPGFSLKSGRRRSTKRLSAAAQLEAGLVDLESPASILASTSLRALLNRHTFQGLPPLYQRKLAQLLPSVDRQDAAISGLNNEFFARACLEWRKRLAEGEFTPENQQRLKMEAERDKNKLDPWKLKHFEPIWGEKREPKLRTGFHCTEPRSVGAVTRSSLRLRPEMNVDQVTPENTRCLTTGAEEKMEQVICASEAIVDVPDNVPSAQDIQQNLPEFNVTVQILEDENLETVNVNINPEEITKDSVEEQTEQSENTTETPQVEQINPECQQVSPEVRRKGPELRQKSQEARKIIEQEVNEEQIVETEEIHEPEEEILHTIEISPNSEISQNEEIPQTIELQVQEEILDWDKMQNIQQPNEEIECLSDEISQTSEELSQTSEEQQPLHQFNKEEFSQLTAEQIYQLECENNSASPQDLIADDNEMIINQQVHEMQNEIHENREIHQEIHQEIRQEIRQEIHQEIHQDIHQDIHHDINQEIHQEIHQEVHQEIHHEVHQEIHHEMSQEILQEMNSEIHHEMHPEIHEIHHEMHREMNHKIQQEMEHEVQQQMHHEIQQELRNDMQTDLQTEIQSDIQTDMQGSNENCTDPESQLPEGMEIDIETLQRIHELEVRGEMRGVYEEMSGCPEEIIYPILEGMEIGSTGEEETEASVISGPVEDVQVQEVEHLSVGNEDEALREANNYVCSEMLECSWAVDPNVGAVNNPNARAQEEIQVSLPLVTSLDGSVAANITVTTHDETSTTTDSTNPSQFITSEAHTEPINCIQLPVVQSTPFQSETLAIGTPVTNCLMKNLPAQSSPIIAFPQLQSIRFLQTSFHSGHGAPQSITAANAIPAQIQAQHNPQQQVSIVRPHEEIVQIGTQNNVVHNTLQNGVQQNPTPDNLQTAVTVQHQNHGPNAIVIQHQAPIAAQSRQIVATLQSQQPQQQTQQYPVVAVSSRPSRSTQGGQRSRASNKEQGGRARSSTKEPPGAVNLERSYQICQAVIQSSPNRDQLKAHLKPPPSLLARGDGAFTTTKSGGRTITTVKTQKSQQSNSHNKQTKGQAVMLRHVFTTARQTAPAEANETNAVTQINSNGNGGLGQYILVQRTGVGDSAPRASSAPPLPPQIAGMGVGVHLVRGRPASAGEGSHQAVTLKARGALDGRGGGGAEPGAPGVIMGGDPPPPWECNMRGAMVICRQCGAFCHDDCIGPQRICATCLIR
ncbi:polycomb protein Asx isoform X2 [Leptopilina heterotoma]|uniref:polycomb protein Asx isoform X2 n=1 Tax=Leptopilina heterotoma TaxID=63436 RepID=UPI001CA7E604|nr:polycomb protein Asx isoform X2 [Leptopilina heterotoma]